jgi:hypothetical protein
MWSLTRSCGRLDAYALIDSASFYIIYLSLLINILIHVLFSRVVKTVDKFDVFIVGGHGPMAGVHAGQHSQTTHQVEIARSQSLFTCMSILCFSVLFCC